MDETAHLDAVEVVALGPEPASDEIASSWLRSANEYRVDASSRRAPNVLTSTELKEQREPLSRLIDVARGEIDGLYRLVRDSGYVVLVCDSQGIAVDHRGDDRLADDFRHWGIWLGGVWSENVEGTNGIGTCLLQAEPVTVHLSQHFRSRHVGLSCSGAPIFGPDGNLLAVVDVSTMNSSLSEHAHGLTGSLTTATARSIEERLFRDAFHSDWVATIPTPSGDAMLLALDRDSRIIGADRVARQALGLDAHQLKEGASLWNYFIRDLSVFRANDGVDLGVALSSVSNGRTVPAFMTPPQRLLAAGPALATHTRPRGNSLAALSMGGTELARGGLSASVIRQIRTFVDEHLSELIDVARLAEIAGLSAFHFSRQFKHSLGVAPHAYILRRRVERTRDLLETTDNSLSEIAIAAGFSDQGHMTRQFRRFVGMTPGQFRRSRR